MFKEYKMEYLKEKKKTPTQLMIKQILIELDSSWKKYHEMKEKTGKENIKELAILILEKEIKYLDLIVNEIDEKLKNIHEEAKLRLKEGKRERAKVLIIKSIYNNNNIREMKDKIQRMNDHLNKIKNNNYNTFEIERILDDINQEKFKGFFEPCVSYVDYDSMIKDMKNLTKNKDNKEEENIIDKKLAEPEEEISNIKGNFSSFSDIDNLKQVEGVKKEEEKLKEFLDE